jgi:hypothetical protein
MFNKVTKTSFSKYLYVLILIGSLVVLSAGCEKKAEKPEGESTMKDTTKMAMPETDTTAKVDTAKMFPDLTGTWTGKFQSHAATMKITEQKMENFKASLTVAYREPMNKSIVGTYNPDTKQLTMKDASKSRLETSYIPKLSDDMKKITGTAHFIVDGNTVNFTFTKK